MHKIKCPRCGNVNEGDSLFCAECGCGLKNAPQKKSGPGAAVFLAVLAVCAALLILAVACVVLFVRGREKKEEEPLGTDVTETQGMGAKRRAGRHLCVLSGKNGIYMRI